MATLKCVDVKVTVPEGIEHRQSSAEEFEDLGSLYMRATSGVPAQNTVVTTVQELAAFVEQLQESNGPVDVGDAYTTGVLPDQPTLF